MNIINLEALKSFLEEANKNTYANPDAPKSASSRLKSEDYHFERDGWIYHDTYFGDYNFIGEEIIYKDQEPVWGANYFGTILDESVGKKEVYGFLRKALMQPSTVIPVRGPNSFSGGNWKYRFTADGDLKSFFGQEEIWFDGKVVYQCFVHGGLIRQ